ncbi:uncharacterized protein LOC143281909 isoform X2 [Babylonia areolata]|uniref:uncharacterized protein LOC143281909 isoform X2 n=1 Tax=Babylonia areolata TaxID=304850 RepID=UPI003FD48D7C
MGKSVLISASGLAFLLLSWMSLFRGWLAEDELFARLCGRQHQWDYFFSFGRVMSVVFRSDGSRTGRGFKLELRVVSHRGDIPTTSTALVPTAGSNASSSSAAAAAATPGGGGGGGGFRDEEGDHRSLHAELTEYGYLHSPDYPFLYYSYERMFWSIRSDAGNVVNLYVTDMDLQGPEPCVNDTVTVYDSDHRTKLATMCSYRDIGVEMNSTRAVLFVHFLSAVAHNGSRGFRLRYRAVGRPTARARARARARLAEARRPPFTWKPSTTTTAATPFDHDNYYILSFVAMVLSAGTCLGIFISLLVHKSRRRPARPQPRRRNRPLTHSHSSDLHVQARLLLGTGDDEGVTNAAFSVDKERPASCEAPKSSVQGTEPAPAVITLFDPQDKSGMAPPPYADVMTGKHPLDNGVDGIVPSRSVLPSK